MTAKDSFPLANPFESPKDSHDDNLRDIRPGIGRWVGGGLRLALQGSVGKEKGGHDYDGGYVWMVY